MRRNKKLVKVGLLLPDAGWKPLGRSLSGRFSPKRQNRLQKLPEASALPCQPRGAAPRRLPTGRAEQGGRWDKGQLGSSVLALPLPAFRS